MLKAFSSGTPKSIKRQNKGPNKQNGKIYPVVDRNWPVIKRQEHYWYSCQISTAYRKITTGVQEKKRTPSVHIIPAARLSVDRFQTC